MEFQGTAISVSVSGSSTVYIACGENRDGGLRAPLLQAGWTEVDGSISTSCCELPSIFRCDLLCCAFDFTLTHLGVVAGWTWWVSRTLRSQPRLHRGWCR